MKKTDKTEKNQPKKLLLKKVQQLCTLGTHHNKKYMAEKNDKKYKVKIGEEQEAGVYANAVSVHLNNNECVIDMAYVLPNTPEPILKLVSRVNMNHKTAESFLKVLSNAILDWKNKQNKE